MADPVTNPSAPTYIDPQTSTTTETAASSGSTGASYTPTSGTQFGTAPAGFAQQLFSKSPEMKQLAADLGISSDQDVYNLLALMRMGGGSDGFFGSGDVVAGAIALGMKLDNNAIKVLKDFSSAHLANGETGNSASMAAALAKNTAMYNEWGVPGEILGLTDNKAAMGEFHQITKDLANTVAGTPGAKSYEEWVAESPWLANIDFWGLEFDWSHLGLKDPQPDSEFGEGVTSPPVSEVEVEDQSLSGSTL